MRRRVMWQHNRPIRGQIIDDSMNFHGPVFRGRGNVVAPSSRVGEATDVKFAGG